MRKYLELTRQPHKQGSLQINHEIYIQDLNCLLVVAITNQKILKKFLYTAHHALLNSKKNYNGTQRFKATFKDVSCVFKIISEISAIGS